MRAAAAVRVRGAAAGRHRLPAGHGHPAVQVSHQGRLVRNADLVQPQRPGQGAGAAQGARREQGGRQNRRAHPGGQQAQRPPHQRVPQTQDRSSNAEGERPRAALGHGPFWPGDGPD